MDDIKRALESIYAIQNQQQATEDTVGNIGNIGEAPSGAQSAQANLDQDVKLKGSFNAKTFGALLGMDSSEASLLASFLAKHKNGMQPSRNELLAAADVFRALIDAETQVTTQALSMLRRIHADTAEGAYESVEDEITQVVDESIRLTKEGVEGCWDDMAAPAAPTQAGETMTVSISMPNKQISVTTDSADEVMNLLKLAGISVAGPAVEPKAPAVDAEPAMVGAPVATQVDTPTGIPGDVDGDGDHDSADHDAEKDSDDEKKDDKAIMGAKEVKEEDIDENAFNQAAAAASRQGKDEFEFPEGSGKMHPVKMDKDSAYQMAESDRILQLAGLGEGKLANSPANTSMDEPMEFDSLPSEKGTGAGKPDYGTRQSNMGGENPMALHSLDMDEAFQQAMGEYRKFVAENISKKK